MKNAIQIVFRRLTAADFYNINKPKGSEARGGGQSYIDFPTSAIRPSDWKRFFSGQKTLTSQSGPFWNFTIQSIGLGKSQPLIIGQRRDASFNVRAQKLGTAESNRVYAWHPQYSGFPALKDPNDRSGIPNLVIYIVKTDGDEYWAGWFQGAKPQANWQTDARLQQMFSNDQGTIYLEPSIVFDETDLGWPFRLNIKAAKAVVSSPAADAVPPLFAEIASSAKSAPAKNYQFKQKSESQILDELFAEDVEPDGSAPAKKLVTVKIRERNSKIVLALKSLYGGKCQISGEQYVFKKLDGEFYCEAHHLIALGEGGADSPYNIIIVSPLIHRMLHYASVTGLDLAKIKNNQLTIQINGVAYTITWHPKHAALVNSTPKEA